MKITNRGRGLHNREVKGIDRFRSELPGDWYGFTNIDLVIGLGRPREVDLVIISGRRIFLIDIKDWRGRIETVDGNWVQNGQDRGPSPVTKVAGIAREIYPLLKNNLASRPETRSLPCPWVTGLVVLTNNVDRSGIAASELGNVLTLDEFLQKVATDRAEREAFGNVAPEFLSRPLTGTFWKDKITKFFIGANFKPGKRRFQRFIADETPSFEPSHGIYREFDAHEEGSSNSFGTLRLWDFTKCPDSRFQTEEGRMEIAGRENIVFNWLRDRSEEVERTLLTPKLEDPERGVNYWEIYDRRRRMQRLSTFAATEAKNLLPDEKIELSRQLLAVLSGLHRHDAAHLDLDGHSIWLETPTSVKVSHLFAARFPEVQSLGPSRYQFLSSTNLPEDFFGEDQGPKRRDVFLVGVAIHLLLFGRKPEGEPPEWNPEIDKKSEYLQLHDWFAEALDLDPNARFADGVKAQDAFLRATASRPTPDEVISGLEQYRGTIRTQRQLASSYPCVGEPIIESDRIDLWRSEDDGHQVVVKLWKKAAWGDTRQEGATILSFLDRATDIKADRPYGLPAIRDVLWLGDSFALVQDWVDGPTLRELLSNPTEHLTKPEGALNLMRRLIVALDAIHDNGYAHGDLKPENIVVTAEGVPVLIDAIDFSTNTDGELISTAYAPDFGGKFERDRFAISKIAEELFATVSFESEDAARLSAAISECREKAPPLATIAPLFEAIEEVENRLSSGGVVSPKTSADRISISIQGAAIGPLEPDEGLLYVRLWRDKVGRRSLHIRGACEELSVRLDDDGNPFSGRRMPLEQRWIARNMRDEFYNFSSSLVVSGSEITDLQGLQPLFDDPVIKAKIEEEFRHTAERPLEGDIVEDKLTDEDEAEDSLAEEIATSQPLRHDIDVPFLWRTLIDTENELNTEAVAQLDSSYSRQMNHHRVPVELESGEFDYARHDTVGVLRQDRKGAWRRIGELDVQLSRPDMAVINAYGYSMNQSGLISAGQRLRFVSHFEVQSLRRRTDAVERILAGSGRLTELLSVFDPRSNAKSNEIEHEIDENLLQGYELNENQKAAFEQILRKRPVGLLQGPPGTGKTRFIAALAHYAISHGLARNVLLTSQSHEAVNTAAEAVLKHFRGVGVQPSLLRVAMNEDIVSPSLRPHHTQRVEQAFKDRFSASFSERLGIAAKTLGIPDPVVDDIVILETVLRPICQNIAALAADETPDQSRINSLKNTLQQHLQRLSMEEFDFDDEALEWDTLPDTIVDQVISHIARSQSIGTDQLVRLRASAVIGRDFVGSISGSQRSFETFLAGTRQIVVGTCVGLGRTSLGLTSTAFDLVIVDEAARCTSSELLVPLQAARWAVLVGDHAQLKPQHHADVVNLVAERTSIPKSEIKRSDFERVFKTGYGSSAGERLKKQYRMLPPIGRLVSDTFYPELNLTAGRVEPEIPPEVIPTGFEKPLTWIETDPLGDIAFEQRDPNSHSRINRIEADAIVAQLELWIAHHPFQEWLETQSKYPSGIGIICMYAAQRDLIIRKLRQSALGYLLDGQIKVGTVDSYQGKENPIIILSLVRNNNFGPLEFGIKRIQEGFLIEPNRVNVAASRAMDRLVIVGAYRRWRQDSPVGRLAAGFKRLTSEGDAVVIDAATLLERDGAKSTNKSNDNSKQAAGNNG